MPPKTCIGPLVARIPPVRASILSFILRGELELLTSLKLILPSGSQEAVPLLAAMGVAALGVPPEEIARTKDLVRESDRSAHLA